MVKSKDIKIVFIIGNGFDLDLGWKTQFSQFASSSHWPSIPSFVSPMYETLNENRQKSLWFDLEQLLTDYANPKKHLTTISNAANDEKVFSQLSTSLISYLKEQQSLDIRMDSTAAKVLSAVLPVHRMAKIYSFNYTDLHLIAEKLGITYGFEYEHVHGSLNDDSAILGIPDSADVVTKYEFLYKTFNRHYTSHEILYDLLDADEVIIFGHSLGKVDYHYFQKFFQKQCQDDMERSQGKRITIFTYDELSRRAILKQLREMNQNRTDLLFNQNELNIFMTDGSDDDKISKFLSVFSKRTRRNYINDAISNVLTTVDSRN